MGWVYCMIVHINSGHSGLPRSPSGQDEVVTLHLHRCLGHFRFLISTWVELLNETSN